MVSIRRPTALAAEPSRAATLCKERVQFLGVMDEIALEPANWVAVSPRLPT